ncbi:hypothetical protein KFE25_007812 [Diacronema lutheri]|uniref:Magnesium-dependent phosphatase-1 n=1 Tax=Diacronema lutheri TaxID=2081491 RepID=A0A8J5Y0X6_DIALT|nr:hypothetical protein KFE25_007812 [Diacronema lutheri]
MAATWILALLSRVPPGTSDALRSGRIRHATALRAGGTLCPRPTAPRPVGLAGHAVDELPLGAALPRLIVFDLDNTLWTPELYTLRHVRGYASAAPPGPVAERDVWLVDGALDVLNELATSERWRSSGVLVAAASRTNKAPWARALLSQLRVPARAGDPPISRVSDLFAHVEIAPGSKLAHFERIRAALGVPYDEMLFFDDARGGSYGNCEQVSTLGVLCVHTPRGLTRDLFALAIVEYSARKPRSCCPSSRRAAIPPAAAASDGRTQPSDGRTQPTRRAERARAPSACADSR